MKKLLLSLVTIMALLLGVAGCSTEEPTVEEVKQEELNITLDERIQKGNGTVEVKFTASKVVEGQTLMETLKSIAEVREQDGFINGVNDMVADPDKKEFIAIYVDGEMAMVGANDLILNDGDVIELKIENWE